MYETCADLHSYSLIGFNCTRLFCCFLFVGSLSLARRRVCLFASHLFFVVYSHSLMVWVQFFFYLVDTRLNHLAHPNEILLAQKIAAKNKSCTHAAQRPKNHISYLLKRLDMCVVNLFFFFSCCTTIAATIALT